MTWVNRKHEEEEIGRVTATRETIHSCSKMTLNFFKKKAVKIDMRDCVKNMIKVFEKEHKLNEREVSFLSNHQLFEVNKDSPKLNNEMAERFHSMTAKAPFVFKRARPDTLLTVSVLCTRVKDATEFE